MRMAMETRRKTGGFWIDSGTSHDYEESSFVSRGGKPSIKEFLTATSCALTKSQCSRTKVECHEDGC